MVARKFMILILKLVFRKLGHKMAIGWEQRIRRTALDE